MKSSISLSMLILKGLLGNVGVGAPLNEVRQLVGEPEELGCGLGKVVIERYLSGWLEISYLNSSVVLIAVYLNRLVLGECSELELDRDFPADVDGNYEAFLTWLDGEGVGYQVYGESEESISWKLISGAVVTFVRGGMDSIQVC